MSSNSYVFYEGPSELDGTPIVGIATNFLGTSVNPKTGNGFINTWILCATMDPLDAIRTGGDHCICGTCGARGVATGKLADNRWCYVAPGHGALPIWEQWQRGGIASLKERRLKAVFAGRLIRLGSYGDPAAIPLHIWRKMMARADDWTGYTHQWRTCHLSYKRWCMASCETEEDREAAHALGWRTYRTTRLNSHEARQDGEIVCPKSKEAGRKLTCDQCRVCSGTDGNIRQTDVVITLHGFTRH